MVIWVKQALQETTGFTKELSYSMDALTVEYL